MAAFDPFQALAVRDPMDFICEWLCVPAIERFPLRDGDAAHARSPPEPACGANLTLWANVRNGLES